VNADMTEVTAEPRLQEIPGSAVERPSGRVQYPVNNRRGRAGSRTGGFAMQGIFTFFLTVAALASRASAGTFAPQDAGDGNTAGPSAGSRMQFAFVRNRNLRWPSIILLRGLVCRGMQDNDPR
jgi:hypothetical protein